MQERTLFLIEASDDSRIEICAVYADNAYNAKTVAAGWLSERQDLPLVEVKPCPDGLVIFFMTSYFFNFPGTIPRSLLDGGDDNASRGAPTNTAAKGSEA